MPRETSAVSARIPPSPRLSARMMSVTYFAVTMMISAQKMIDRIPSTFAGVSATGCSPAKHWRSV